MEYIPAISLLAFYILFILILFRRVTGEQLAKMVEGKNFLLLATASLFGLLLVLHLFQNQPWTGDILKVIAGVFVGASASLTSKSEKASVDQEVQIEKSEFGDNTRIAGRDINETIENMQAQVAQIKDAVVNQYPSILRDLSTSTLRGEPADYLLNTIYERDGTRISQAMEKITNRWRSEGWTLQHFTSDYHGMDGIFLVFTRPSQGSRSQFLYFHGSEMSQV